MDLKMARWRIWMRKREERRWRSGGVLGSGQRRRRREGARWKRQVEQQWRRRGGNGNGSSTPSPISPAHPSSSSSLTPTSTVLEKQRRQWRCVGTVTVGDRGEVEAACSPPAESAARRRFLQGWWRMGERVRDDG